MIEYLIQSLQHVTHPRFYDTERGFQGEFLVHLRNAMPGAALPGDAIVEQEYQKRIWVHGIASRPDIVIHIPTPPDGLRTSGNFAVCELKLAAQADQAQEDFKKLDAVLAALQYQLGCFINIASGETFASVYKGHFPDRMHCFAVQLTDQGDAHVVHARPQK